MEWHEATIWEATADIVGDRDAIVKGADRRTWQQFEDRAARLASVLLDHGLGPGATVGLMMTNVPEFLETYFAALKIRAVPFNVNFRYREPEVAHLLDNAAASVLVYESDFADVVVGAVERSATSPVLLDVGTGGGVPGGLRFEDVIDQADPAPRIARDPGDITITYTGGTTGFPKAVAERMGPGVQRGMGMLPPLLGHPPITSPEQVAPFAAARSAERDWMVGMPAAPMVHATGLSLGALTALGIGGTVALLPSRTFDADEVWDTVEAERVTAITVVGDAFALPMSRRVAEDDGRDLDSLRLLNSSGALLSAHVKEALLERLPQLLILDFVAATEGLMGIAVANAQTGVTPGRFTPTDGVILVAEDGEKIEPGSDRVGLIAVPGGEGYLGDDVASAKVTRTVDGTTYTLPGDWATIEADGSMVLLGRGSTCINTAGEKVYPEEVEEVLKALPGIVDAIVFGVEDERFGQRVAAVVAGSDEALDVETLVAGAKEHLAAYKVPRSIVRVSDVPRLVTGKPDFPAARAAWVEAQSDSER